MILLVNISVHNEINFSLSDEEFEILNNAWSICKDIASKLWINDREDTELYDYAYGSYSNIDEMCKLAGRRMFEKY